MPKDELPEVIGPETEEKPVTCDLCRKEIVIGTPDDGTVAVGPDGGTWNVCAACRAKVVSQFPEPHEYASVETLKLLMENGKDIVSTDDEEEADTPDA